MSQETGRQRVLPPTPQPRDLAEEGLESWAGDVFWGPRPLPSFLPLAQAQEEGLQPLHVAPKRPIRPPFQSEVGSRTGLQEWGAGVQRMPGGFYPPPSYCTAHSRSRRGWTVLVTWGQQWVWKKPRLAGPAQDSMQKLLQNKRGLDFRTPTVDGDCNQEIKR